MKNLSARFISILVMLALILTFIPQYSVQAAGYTQMKTGDFIQFGKYNGDPILWRVININDDGSTLLYSENILCMKPFDAAGDMTDGRGDLDRKISGSNYWENSNIREWLNSSDKAVKYSCQAPDNNHVWKGENDYSREAGFLYNFTSAEREAIQPVNHACLLSEFDKSVKDGGTKAVSSLQEVGDYDEAYFRNVTDKVFFLNRKELNDYVQARGWSVLRMPAKKALANDESGARVLFAAASGYANNWLRNPEGKNSYTVTGIGPGFINGSIEARYAAGVAPALNLKSGVTVSKGSGSRQSPYVVTGYTKPNVISVYLNGKKLQFDQASVEDNLRILVPMKKIFDELGAKVQWDQKTQKVTAVVGYKSFDLQVNSKSASVKDTAGNSFDYSKLSSYFGLPSFTNIMSYKLDAPAKIVNGTVMVPLEFIMSHVVGSEVKWDRSARTVQITANKALINDVFAGEVVDRILSNKMLDIQPTYETFCNDNILDENGQVKWNIKAADAVSDLSLSNFQNNIGDPVYPEIDNILMDIAKNEEKNAYENFKVSHEIDANAIKTAFSSMQTGSDIIKLLADSQVDEIQMGLLFNWMKDPEQLHNFKYWWNNADEIGAAKVFSREALGSISAETMETQLKTLAANCSDVKQFTRALQTKYTILGKGTLPGALKFLSNVFRVAQGTMVGIDSLQSASFLNRINENTILRFKQLAADTADPKIKDEINKTIEKTQKDFYENLANGFATGMLDTFTADLLTVAAQKSAQEAAKYLSEKAGEKLFMGSGIFASTLLGIQGGAILSNLTMNSNDILSLNLKIAAAVRMKKDLKASLETRLRGYMKSPTRENRNMLITSLINFYSVDVQGAEYLNELLEAHKNGVIQSKFRNAKDDQDLDDTIKAAKGQTDILRHWENYIECFKEPEVSPTEVSGGEIPAVCGNTVGNIMNSGFAAIQGDWIYYTSNDGYRLYKIKTDGTCKTRLNDELSYDIKISGDWVYYVTKDREKDYLCRVKTDGSGRKVLDTNPDALINIADGWEYYYNTEYSKVKKTIKSQLYKIHVDSRKLVELTDSPSVIFRREPVYFTASSVYFIGLENTTLKSGVYKMNLDGSKNTKLSNTNSLLLVREIETANLTDKWIYYVSSQDSKLYKISTDGNQKSKLSDDQCEYINLEGDWVYYLNDSDEAKLYKIRTNGTDRQKLSDESCQAVNIAGDWIYYMSASEKIFRMHKDGTERQAVN